MKTKQMIMKLDAKTHWVCRAMGEGTANLQRALSLTGRAVILMALVHSLGQNPRTRVRDLRCAFWIHWACLSGCLMCSVDTAGPLTAAARMPKPPRPKKMPARHPLHSLTGRSHEHRLQAVRDSAVTSPGWDVPWFISRDCSSASMVF